MPASRIRGPSAHQIGPSPSHTRVGLQGKIWPEATAWLLAGAGRTQPQAREQQDKDGANQKTKLRCHGEAKLPKPRCSARIKAGARLNAHNGWEARFIKEQPPAAKSTPMGIFGFLIAATILSYLALSVIAPFFGKRETYAGSGKFKGYLDDDACILLSVIAGVSASLNFVT
jgi:hypothetical protein